MSHCYRYEWRDAINGYSYLLIKTPKGNALFVNGVFRLALNDFDAKQYMERCFGARSSKVKQNTPWSTQGAQDIKLVEGLMIDG